MFPLPPQQLVGNGARIVRRTRETGPWRVGSKTLMKGRLIAFVCHAQMHQILFGDRLHESTVQREDRGVLAVVDVDRLHPLGGLFQRQEQAEIIVLTEDEDRTDVGHNEHSLRHRTGRDDTQPD